jgi:hypothetical protein
VLPDRPTATVIKEAPIFINPGAQTPLRVAAVGTTLNVLGEDAGWLQVEFQDPQWGRRVGWIQKESVRISAPDQRPMDLSIKNEPPVANPSGGARFPAAPPPDRRRASQKGDVGFSYSILHESALADTLPAGWVVAANGNLGRFVGVVGEFGGNYKTINVVGTGINVGIHSYMGGIRLRGETSKAIPFAQFLVGGVRRGVGALGESDSVTDFALQPGGGVDVRVTRQLAIRAQGDYRWIRLDGGHSNEYRFAFGLAIGF